MQEEQAQGQVDWFLESCKKAKAEHIFLLLGISAFCFVLVVGGLGIKCC